MRSDSIIEFPGFVDVHVHLRDPGGLQKEDFDSGTKAAIAGGYTQILDMPNNIPPTVTEKNLDGKIKRAHGRIWCDLGFNFGANSESIRYFSKIYKKSFGLKVYMSQTTGPLLINNSKERDLVFKSWQSNLPIMVHAKGIILKVAINLAAKYNKRIHVCHVTADQIDLIVKSRKKGISITCEVSPHHLFLNQNDLKKLGPLGLMKPPLLSKREQQYLWRNLNDIDMIATDHAPHTLQEKKNKLPPYGVPGLETTLPLMLDAVSKKLLSINRLVEMLAKNPRKIFKLPKQKNTYILVDMSNKFKISNKNLFTKCNWTPFVGLKGRGKIEKVVIRGKIIFEKGKFATEPIGKVVYPGLNV